MKWPRATTRWARIVDVPYLTERLAEDPTFEKIDLTESIVRVVEYDDAIVGFGAIKLAWRVEPVFLFPEFKKHAPRMAQQRATYLLIRDLDSYIMGEEVDGLKDTVGIKQYFCFILDKTMQKLALAFKMLPAYTGGAFFGRRIFNRED
jgi:hypothetical protein